MLSASIAFLVLLSPSHADACLTAGESIISKSFPNRQIAKITAPISCLRDDDGNAIYAAVIKGKPIEQNYFEYDLAIVSTSNNGSTRHLEKSVGDNTAFHLTRLKIIRLSHDSIDIQTYSDSDSSVNYGFELSSRIYKWNSSELIQLTDRFISDQLVSESGSNGDSSAIELKHLIGDITPGNLPIATTQFWKISTNCKISPTCVEKRSLIKSKGNPPAN